MPLPILFLFSGLFLLTACDTARYGHAVPLTAGTEVRYPDFTLQRGDTQTETFPFGYASSIVLEREHYTVTTASGTAQAVTYVRLNMQEKPAFFSVDGRNFALEHPTASHGRVIVRKLDAAYDTAVPYRAGVPLNFPDFTLTVLEAQPVYARVRIVSPTGAQELSGTLSATEESTKNQPSGGALFGVGEKAFMLRLLWDSKTLTLYEQSTILH